MADPAEIMQALGMPLLVLDNDLAVISVNRSFNEIFNLSGSDIAGIPVFAVGGLFDTPSVRESLLAALSSRKSGERPEIVSGQRTFEMDCVCLPQTSAPGGRCLLVTLWEITCHRQAENEVRRVNRQLSIINRIISATTSPMHPADILQAVLKNTVQLLDFDAGAIYLVNSKIKKAELKAFMGVYDLYFPDVLTLDICRSQYREVFLERRACYGEKYFNISHESGELGVFSLASIPILVGPDVIGSINIASSSFHQFTDLEREILESIGKEVGGAINRGMLQAELEAAHDEANLYLDVLTHDVSNANLLVVGYAGILAESVDGPLKGYAENILAGIEQSAEIIRNVSKVRDFRERKVALRHSNLDEAIRSAIRLYPDVKIFYNGCGIRICADELLGEIFANLIGNSVKFGGPDVRICIRAKAYSGQICIRIEDNGPGIPDDLKSAVFRRFVRGTGQVRGRGLGLYICKMLVERYDGSIEIEDRIPDVPESGAAIVITFPTVDHEPPS